MRFQKNKIKELREQRGLSRRQFAKMLEVPRQSVIQWEEKQCCPNVHTLAKICKVFEVSPDYFFV